VNQPSARQRVGLALAGLLSLTSIPSVLMPTPEGEVGPPYAVLLLSSVVGVIGIVAVVLAWRGNAAALRVAAGAVIIPTLTGLPAFFVDVPLAVRLLVAVSLLLAVASVVLMLSSTPRPVPVMD
jgi:hypothetical protein